MELTKEQIKYFIENYGNDDVYFNHRYEGINKDIIYIEYFPHLGKMTQKENYNKYIKDLMMAGITPKVIIVTNKYAKILSKDVYDKTLEKNYKKFLKDLKNENNIEK